MKIYTKKGDAGQTGLFDGTRVPKSDPRIDAYGDVDETNSAIGAARAFVEDPAIGDFLRGIQSDLFAVGAQLADPKYDAAKRKAKTRITEARVQEFERFIDGLEAKLPPLKNFILPAGNKGGAVLHLARCVCRRAERRVVALAAAVKVAPIVVKYLNRLSDLLFVMARAENQRTGEQQVDW
jgi:cob(I)alamin adenosyltransferase